MLIGEIKKRVKQAGKQYFTPNYSLYATDKLCNYTLIAKSKNADEIVNRFREECFKDHYGLEIRCNGVRVNLN